MGAAAGAEPCEAVGPAFRAERKPPPPTPASFRRVVRLLHVGHALACPSRPKAGEDRIPRSGNAAGNRRYLDEKETLVFPRGTGWAGDRGGAGPASDDALARGIGPVYLVVVSPLENIVEDLKTLPPARLEVAADFVHRLKRISEEERQAILIRTAGVLSPEEADELERAIEDGCESVDEHGW